MKLSVVIVNYNVRYFLEQCLHSIKKAMQGIEGEVIVVDNNSVDGSVEMVKAKFPEVHCIVNRENFGFARANNQAIRVAAGEYVLLLNPDTVVEEDTFRKSLAFMDVHPEAGALGVKMIDGKGKFLPESKRGFPSPSVAFCKIFGLSQLFPKSKIFGRYHLGFLDKDHVHEVDVLSGAFMLLRGSALSKAGLLDETFFMYGEDIDLSYRIVQAGYKNYYFPETSIIHYKGESTKKSSVNYVFVFYRAMIIFARKHFSQQHAAVFSFLISLAIYFRASVAVLVRFFKKIFFPVADILVIYAGIFFIKRYWETQVKHIDGGYYPGEFMYLAVPAYILVWLLAVFFSGGYDTPVKIARIVRGIIYGTVIILVAYALLPESHRFSRAIIILGSAWAMVAMILLRAIANQSGIKEFALEKNKRKRLVIVGKQEESGRVASLLHQSGARVNFIGFVTPDREKIPPEHHAGTSQPMLGGLDRLDEILEIYQADEVIFCAKDISSAAIIHTMSKAGKEKIEYKIAPPESLYIIGSSSVNRPGELYVLDLNTIGKQANRRNKRMLDVLVCLFMLPLSPVLICFTNPAGLVRNWMRVLSGNYSWVGYAGTSGVAVLPGIKKGILSPLNAVSEKTASGSDTADRLNLLYAKDYRIYNDVVILFKGMKQLGNKDASV